MMRTCWAEPVNEALLPAAREIELEMLGNDDGQRQARARKVVVQDVLSRRQRAHRVTPWRRWRVQCALAACLLLLAAVVIVVAAERSSGQV